MNKRFYFLQIILFFCICSFSFAEVEVEKQAKIAEDIKQCFSELDNLLSEDDVEDFKNASSEEVANYHFTTGRLIRNNCGLLEDTRLRKFFIDNNIARPDDMSMVILKCYYLYLNNKDFDIEKLMAKFRGSLDQG